MKGREGKGPPSTDLLVCFPSRAHLTLMPKPICSPARPQEPNKRHHQHHLKKSINRSHKGMASPVPWAKHKAYGKEIDEPTSPRITCAGQIKVKPKASSCKNWQSVMEEIERMHNHRKSKKRPTWVEALGFKKDVMQFLTCLRTIRFDFRCFGAFPSSSITSDDDEEDEDDDEFHNHNHKRNQNQNQNQESKEPTEDLDSESSRTVFSKWFMVLQEGSSGNNKDFNRMIRNKFSHGREESEAAEDDDDQPCAPPPNALLLMRCRSAPAKSWMELKREEEQEEEEEEEDDDDEHAKMVEKLKMEEEEEEKKRKENLIVMRCGTDFNKFSSDIAKETWVVGGIKEVLSRSRSWKR